MSHTSNFRKLRPSLHYGSLPKVTNSLTLIRSVSTTRSFAPSILQANLQMEDICISYPKIRDFNVSGHHWSALIVISNINNASVVKQLIGQIPPLPFRQQAVCSEARIGLAISCSATKVRIDASARVSFNLKKQLALNLLLYFQKTINLKSGNRWTHIRIPGSQTVSLKAAKLLNKDCSQTVTNETAHNIKI